MLPNLPEFAVVYYGVLRAGGVVVPMNPLLKAREVAYYLGDSGARLLFAWHGFADEATAGAARPEPRRRRRPRVVRRGARAEEPDRDVADRAGRRHRGDPVHLGHHRQAEGRRAHPRQPDRERRGRGGATCSGSTADDVIFGGLPLFHSFGQTCALNAAMACGRLPHAAASLRPGEGAEIIAARPRDGLRGRADDVRRRCCSSPDRDGLRRVRAAIVRLRWGGAAGGGAARLRGGLRLHHPRGIRAVGDLAGGLVQPPGPAAQAGLDRHADRGRGDAGRRRARRRASPTARSARSRSAATT